MSGWLVVAVEGRFDPTPRAMKANATTKGVSVRP